MPYHVEHLRVTLECDACGLVEKQESATQVIPTGWDTIKDRFCCPTCREAVYAILEKKKRLEAGQQGISIGLCAPWWRVT